MQGHQRDKPSSIRHASGLHNVSARPHGKWSLREAVAVTYIPIPGVWGCRLGGGYMDQQIRLFATPKNVLRISSSIYSHYCLNKGLVTL